MMKTAGQLAYETFTLYSVALVPQIMIPYSELPEITQRAWERTAEALTREIVAHLRNNGSIVPQANSLPSGLPQTTDS